MGKAIIIENTDFSGNSIGKVTFIEDSRKQANRIVSNYQSRIGSTEFSGALEKMVKALIDNDIYDGLNGIYPIIGTTQEQLCADLMGKHNVVIDSQLMKPSTNILMRTTTVATNVPSAYDFAESRVTLDNAISSIGATAFVRMNKKHTSGGVTIGIIDSNPQTLNPAKIGSYAADVNAYFYGGNRVSCGTFPDGFATLGMHLRDANKVDVYVNSSKEEKEGNSVYDVYQLNYSLGAYSTGSEVAYSSNNQAASGDISFYLFGYVDDSKMEILKAIVDEFIASKGI